MVSLEDEICDSLEFSSIFLQEDLCEKNLKIYRVGSEGPLICVKHNNTPLARMTFDGEMSSLQTIQKTETIQVPIPYGVVNIPDSIGAVLVYEHLDLKPLRKHQKMFGEKLAEMHRYNYIQMRRLEKAYSWANKAYNDLSEKVIHEYGFEQPTCLNGVEQPNEWDEDWVKFFARQKLKYEIDILMAQRTDRECLEEWSKLQLKLDHLFKNSDDEPLKIFPSLLHGNLWEENISELEIVPVIHSPCSFYGHWEYDLAIGHLLGGMTEEFDNAYQKVYKPQHNNKMRLELYKLYYTLNRWNHLGPRYKEHSLFIMKKLNDFLYKGL